MKDFDNWNRQKKEIQEIDNSKFFIKTREIWFIRFWENVWFEQSWNWEMFKRPVLVLNKIWNLFFCAPLTKWWKDNQYYHTIKSIDFWVKSKVVLSQCKVIDSKRFYKNLWTISGKEFEKIKKLLKKFYL